MGALAFYSDVIKLTALEREAWKAIRRTNNRVTHAVIFTYGRNTKPTGVFKIKFKHS